MAYQVKGAPWRAKGAVNVEDCKTSEEVMNKARLNFTVDKCPIVAKMPFDPENCDNMLDMLAKGEAFTHNKDMYMGCPSAFATYRTDVNVPLGLVKSKYEIVQNINAFKFFDDAIGKNKAIWQTAGAFGNGERIFVSAKLPSNIRVNNDVVDNYLVFSNSHDGTSGVNILFTPIRVICQNTLNAAIKTSEQFVRFRHTASVHNNIDTASDLLGIVDVKRLELEEMFNSLTKIKLTDKQVKEYIAKIHLTEGEFENVNMIDNVHGLDRLFARQFTIVEDSKISTRKLNIITQTFDYYQNGIGQKEIAGTAWGAYNAITGYYSNVANLSDLKRMDSVLYGNANRVMIEGFNLALNN